MRNCIPLDTMTSTVLSCVLGRASKSTETNGGGGGAVSGSARGERSTSVGTELGDLVQR
jgi:hypothetical protein